jgi:hypothetical protein
MARSVTAPATEIELRSYTEKRLLRALPDLAWDALEDRAREVLDHPQDLDEFVEYVLAVTSPDKAPIKRGKRGDRWDWVKAREYAVSRVIAREMSQNRELIKFRRDLLGPQAALVAPDRLGDWVHARGARHQATRTGDVILPIWVLVGGEPKYRILRLPADGQLADLARFAGKIANDYNIDPADAATFIVTGTPPNYSAANVGIKGASMNGRGTRIRILDGRLFNQAVPGRSYHARITLSIDPALTADEVRDLYAGALRDYFPSDQRHARPAARSIRAGGEVVELFDGEPSADAWRSWNRRHPEDQWKAPNGRVPFRTQVLVALRHLR